MNKLITSIRIALRALKVNRARSALTMLGIIIGVAAVIAMVGVGAGATAQDPAADPEHREQPDHRAAGQHQQQRRAARLRRGSNADAGRREGHRGRVPVRRYSRPYRARRSTGGIRKQQLGHQCPGSHSGLHDDPRLHHVVRPVFHDTGRGCGRQNGRVG